MAIKRRKMILVELAPRRAGKSAKLQKMIEKTAKRKLALDKYAHKADLQAHRAAERVDRQAYTFTPDVLVAVGIDYKNQRIMVTPVEGKAVVLLDKLAAVCKQEMILGRMQRGWGLGRDCAHPRQRISYKNYCVGTNQGVACFKRAKFCTACGEILSQVDDKLRATVEEIIKARVAAHAPVVRRAK